MLVFPYCKTQLHFVCIGCYIDANMNYMMTARYPSGTIRLTPARLLKCPLCRDFIKLDQHDMITTGHASSNGCDKIWRKFMDARFADPSSSAILRARGTKADNHVIAWDNYDKLVAEHKGFKRSAFMGNWRRYVNNRITCECGTVLYVPCLDLSQQHVPLITQHLLTCTANSSLLPCIKCNRGVPLDLRCMHHATHEMMDLARKELRVCLDNGKAA